MVGRRISKAYWKLYEIVPRFIRREGFVFSHNMEVTWGTVPGHDYSTHHKFTHDINDCPEVDLTSVGASPPLNGMKYYDAGLKEREV